jgi:hypothetical protein
MKVRFVFVSLIVWTAAAKANPTIAFSSFRRIPIATVRTLPASLVLPDGTTQSGTLAETRHSPFRFVASQIRIMGYSMPFVLAVESGLLTLAGVLGAAPPEYTFYPGEVTALSVLNRDTRVSADRSVLLKVPAAERRHLGSLFRGERQQWGSLLREYHPKSVTVVEEGSPSKQLHRLGSIVLEDSLSEERFAVPKSEVQPVWNCRSWLSRLLK